ncbi:hypothetical protein BH11ARM2_BH11ARM2_13310 [soil metagenome]
MADENEVVLRPGAGRVPWWTKAFVLVHVVCITVWALPSQPEAAINGNAPARGSDRFLVWNVKTLKANPLVQDYLFSTGSWQYWDMFSPNPSNQDLYGDAMVTFKDGTTKRYQYPRMYTTPIGPRYLKERYRKFYERAHLEKYAYFWRVFARRIALENFTDPNNPPVKVVLWRHWMPIAGPGEVQQKEYASFPYWTYAVQVDAIRKEAGYK